jgi:hypothetical protein
MKDKLMSLLYSLLLGGSVILAVSLPLKSTAAIFSFSLAYFFFFYLPFAPVAEMIADIGIIEKFLLINIAGLSYAGIFVVMDVIFKIPLTKPVFFSVSMLAMLLIWGYYFKRHLSERE